MTDRAFEPIDRAGQERVGDWTREAARDLTEKGRESVEQSSGYLREVLERARATLSEYRDGGMDRARQDIVRSVREQPLAAMMLAIGAGLLIGWLTTLRRR